MNTVYPILAGEAVACDGDCPLRSLSGPVPVVIDRTGLNWAASLAAIVPALVPPLITLQKCARVLEYKAMPVQCNTGALCHVRTVGAYGVTCHRNGAIAITGSPGHIDAQRWTLARDDVPFKLLRTRSRISSSWFRSLYADSIPTTWTY